MAVCIPGLPLCKVQDKVGKETILHSNRFLPLKGQPFAPAAGRQPVTPKQPAQFRNGTADLCCDHKTIAEENIDDGSNLELIPLSASKPLGTTLNMEATIFEPSDTDLAVCGEKPSADCGTVEDPVQPNVLQVHSDTSTTGTDHSLDSMDLEGCHSNLSPTNNEERPPEVTFSESEEFLDTQKNSPCSGFTLRDTGW